MLRWWNIIISCWILNWIFISIFLCDVLLNVNDFLWAGELKTGRSWRKINGCAKRLFAQPRRCQCPSKQILRSRSAKYDAGNFPKIDKLKLKFFNEIRLHSHLHVYTMFQYLEHGVYEKVTEYLTLMGRTELLTCIATQNSFGKIRDQAQQLTREYNIQCCCLYYPVLKLHIQYEFEPCDSDPVDRWIILPFRLIMYQR